MKNTTNWRVDAESWINDQPILFVTLGDGWYGLEDWGGTPTRWTDGDAMLVIESKENLTTKLSFQTQSFYRPRYLNIYINDIPLVSSEIPNEGCTNVNITTISLNKGANLVRFHVPEGGEKPCDIPELNNSDSRCLSMAFRDVKIV